MSNFSKDLVARASRLRDAACPDRGECDTAAIAWLGYDAPNNALFGVQEGPAREGGRLLAEFVKSLGRINSKASRTVVGHSYGSAAVGAGMSSGLGADSVVHTGSPGVGADSIAATGFSGDVYVARAVWDAPVNANLCFGELVQICPFEPHGPPPDLMAGVRPLSVGSASGHSAYYARQSTSLRSIAAVVTGSVRRNAAGTWGRP